MLAYGIILSLLAGFAITVGAMLAKLNVFTSFWLKNEIKHGVTAFGGGALVSAIALILIPDGSKMQEPASTLVTFMLGGLVFMLIDVVLNKSKKHAAQFIAMMLDFIPEVIVLGVIVSIDFDKAIFLTIIIIAQNIPEGYASFIEMRTKYNSQNLLIKFILISLTAPIYILLGASVFINHPVVLGMMMTFCSGGILYLIFEDIAPKSVIKNHWLPPFGAVLGFMAGLSGYLYI